MSDMIDGIRLHSKDRKSASCKRKAKGRLKQRAMLSAAAGATAMLVQSAMGANGPDTWTGATSSTWSPSAGVNWSGTNTLPVSGDSLVFTGTNGAGGLNLNNNLTSGSFSVAGITFNSGALAYVIGDGTATDTNAGNTFALTGAITNNSNSLETINNPFSMTTTIGFATTSGGGDITLGGNISGTGGGLNVDGTGTLTLTGSNSFTGLVRIGDSGANTLSIAAVAALGTPGAESVSTNYLSIQNNSTLQYTGTGNETITRYVFWNIGAANVNITSSTADLTFSESIAAVSGNQRAQALTKQGAGTLTISQTSTTEDFYGSFVISAGTLAFNAGTGAHIALATNSGNVITGAAGTTISVSGPGIVGNDDLTSNWTSNLAGMNIASGSTFDLRGNNVIVDALNGSGTIENTYYEAQSGILGSQLTVGVNGGSGTFAGAINGTSTTTGSATGQIQVVKAGTGTQGFSGSSTYSGTTTISAGTLLANNGASNGSATGSGNITVAAGATLGGNGAVTGTVALTTGTIKAVGGTSGTTLANGGTITAGSSTTAAGTLSTGNQTWGAGTLLAAKIVSITGSSNTVPIAGTDNDTISTGTINASAISTTLPFDVRILSGGSAATNFQAAGANNYTFQLASFTSLTGPGSFVFNHASSGQVTPLATSGSGTGAGTVTVPTADSGLFVLDTSSFNTANSGSASGEFELELVANGTSGAGFLDAVYYSSAPEPGTAALILSGVLPILMRRQRRRAK